MTASLVDRMRKITRPSDCTSGETTAGDWGRRGAAFVAIELVDWLNDVAMPERRTERTRQFFIVEIYGLELGRRSKLNVFRPGVKSTQIFLGTLLRFASGTQDISDHLRIGNHRQVIP